MLFTNTDCLCFAKDPAVVRYRSRYWLYYSLRHEDGRFGIGIAESADMEHWTPCGEIEQDALCETNGIAAPGAIVLNDQIHLFYQTYGNWEKDAICHAWSQDGIHFTKNPENPVFHPAATWCCGRAIDADVCVFGGKYTCILQRATMPCASRKLAAYGQKSILTLGGMRGIRWQNRVCLCQNLHGRAIASKHPQRS